MPWKGEKNPYRIWLSEIILQQTRVEQGWAYYEKFLSAYPAIGSLAKAKEKEVFKLWEGLGYYNRCRNLLSTAKKIVSLYQGRFPSSYGDILELPGIGPYTAAAIASFAFGLPHAVVDANVQRILARYFGISVPSHSIAGKNLYQSLAQALLHKKDPGVYNQAIMDFGAVICKAKNPLCSICVLSESCQAFRHQWVDLLPLRTKPGARKMRWFYYFIVDAGDRRYWIRERQGKDIWKNLYEFVLWETEKIIPHRQIGDSDFVKTCFGRTGFRILHISAVSSQMLTHQTIHGCFVHIRLDKQRNNLHDFRLVPAGQLKNYPFPGLIKAYLKTTEYPFI